MAVFDGYLLCADFDGTLTDSHGKLSEGNAKAIRYFQENGGLFTVASGRYPRHLFNFTDKMKPNTFQIMGNGTTLYDMDTGTIKEEYFLPEPPEAVLRFNARKRLSDLVFVNHRTYSTGWSRKGREVPSDMDRFLMTQDLDKLLSDELGRQEGLPEEKWHKIDFCFKTPEETVAAQELMRETFPQFVFERSWATGFDLLAPGGGKGPASRRLKKRLGDKARVLVCVGDYENDLDMIEGADIGYAVSNAASCCLEAADRVTVSCDEDAVAHIVADLERDSLSRRG